MIKNAFLSLFFASIISACCSSNQQDKDRLPFIDVRKNYPEKEIILTDIAEITYLHLNTDKDDYLYKSPIRSLTVTNNTIVIYDNSSGSILFFSKNGTPQSRFNHFGQGPREYINNDMLLHIIYDEEQDDVYVCDVNSILIYSSSGEFKRKISLPENVKAYTTTDFDDKSLFVNSIPHVNDWSLADWDGVTDLIPSSYFTTFYQISKTDGAVLDSLEMPSNVTELYYKNEYGYTASLNIFNRISKGSDGLFLCNPEKDTIFQYTKEKTLTPVFHKIPPFRETKPKSFINNWCEIGDYRFFDKFIFHKDSEQITYFLEKKSNEIFREKIVLPDYKNKNISLGPGWIHSSSVTNGRIFELDLIELKQAYRENKLNGQLKSLVVTLNEFKDNNVFMLVNFK